MPPLRTGPGAAGATWATRSGCGSLFLLAPSSISGAWGNATYKSFVFTDCAFFFMNHAGSASGLSVCETTALETSDLTHAGKFPSITRGKCRSRRERHRAGNGPRGRAVGAGCGAGAGLGGREPPAGSRGRFWAALASQLALPRPGRKSPFPPCSSFSSLRKSFGSQASPFFTPVFAQAVPTGSDNTLPFQNPTPGPSGGADTAL